MFPYNEIHKLCHKNRVSGQSVGVTEICDKSEMKVPVSRMSRDTRNESMLGKECLHVARTLCQTLRQKTDVLRDERRAFRAILADQTQKSLPDVAGELDDLGDARELVRLDQPGGTHEL